MNISVKQNHLARKTLDYGKMIKFSHTIFALPFALSAVVLAWQTNAPSAWDLFWILTAMVSARSAAMGFNRIVYAGIDKKKPQDCHPGDPFRDFVP
jgi:4-hydroxybenzoate polyprenyltransferase